MAEVLPEGAVEIPSLGEARRSSRDPFRFGGDEGKARRRRRSMRGLKEEQRGHRRSWREAWREASPAMWRNALKENRPGRTGLTLRPAAVLPGQFPAHGGTGASPRLPRHIRERNLLALAELLRPLCEVLRFGALTVDIDVPRRKVARIGSQTELLVQGARALVAS